MRSHLFPFRTQKLSSHTPTILGWQRPGKIGSRRDPKEALIVRSTPLSLCFAQRNNTSLGPLRGPYLTCPKGMHHFGPPPGPKPHFPSADGPRIAPVLSLFTPSSHGVILRLAEGSLNIQAVITCKQLVLPNTVQRSFTSFRMTRWSRIAP